MIQSERSSGCFIRRGADHSIEEASWVDIESIGIFDQETNGPFHEDERISRSGNMKKKGTIVALTIQNGQDAVESHNDAMQLWIGMKNVGADRG